MIKDEISCRIVLGIRDHDQGGKIPLRDAQ